MSRVNKYRGKDRKTGQWVYGSYVKTAIGLHYIVPQNLISNELLMFVVDPETVGQFIGLPDKNDKEIYQGDLVEYTRIIYADCSRTEIEDIQEPVTGEIYYAEGLWLGIKFADGTGKLFLPGQVSTQEKNPELEVIGNIYEHSHLMEIAQ